MLPSSFTPSLLKQLELLRLRSKRAFLGSRQGGHLSLKRGHGQEFSDYRKYELGDHPRYIDWGVYARSERLYVKRFQEEQDLPVLIVLDSSASMDAAQGEDKFERAKEICLALAYVALIQQDSVTLGILGQAGGPKYFGVKAIHQISDRLQKIKAVSKPDFSKDMRQVAASFKFPGVAIVVSDFFMPLVEVRKGFNALRARNLDITALQIIGPSDLSPFTGVSSAVAVDSESGEEINLDVGPQLKAEYQSQFQAHNKSLRDYFSENRITFSSCESSKPIANLLVNNLSKVGMLA